MPSVRELSKKERNSINRITLGFNKVEKFFFNECVKSLLENGIELIPFFSSNRLEKLALRKDNLEKITPVIKILSKSGQLKREFDFVLRNSSVLKNKASEIVNMFVTMRALGIDIKSNSRAVLKLSGAALQQLNIILSIVGDNFTSSDFKIIRDGIPDSTLVSFKREFSESLGKCFKHMRDNGLSLIPTSPLRNKKRLEDLMRLKAAELAAVAAITKVISNGRALDGSTLDDLISKAKVEYLSAKKDEVVALFTQMNKRGIEIKGNRQAIIKDLEAGSIKNLATVLDNVGVNFTSNDFNTLRMNISESYRGEADGFFASLGKCFKHMRDNRLSLIPTSPLRNKKRLEDLLGLKEVELAAVAAITKVLSSGKALDGSTLDDLINKAKAKGLSTKKDVVVALLTKMNERGIDIKGNRQAILKDLEVGNLKNLTTVLDNAGANFTNDDFNTLRMYINQDYSGEADVFFTWLGKCFKHMRNNGLSLIPTSPLRNKNRLEDLMGLKEVELAAVAAILKVISNGKALDGSTLDDLINKAKVEDLSAKKSEIVTLLTKMNERGIEIKRSQQTIIKDLEVSSLKNLATVLDNAGANFTFNDFYTLQINLSGKYRGENDDFFASLGKCFKYMRDNGLSLIPSSPLRNKKRLQDLMGLKETALGAVAAITEVLSNGKALDGSILDGLINKAKVGDLSVKKGAVVALFTMMNERGIEIKGNRQTIIKDLNAQQLGGLLSIINRIDNKKILNKHMPKLVQLVKINIAGTQIFLKRLLQVQNSTLRANNAEKNRQLNVFIRKFSIFRSHTVPQKPENTTNYYPHEGNTFQ